MPTATLDKRSVATESTRSKVRAWVLAKVYKQAEVEIPELAHDAVAHFKKDATFVDALFTESLYDLVYAIASKAVGSTRIINTPDITPEEGDGAPPKSVFYRWMEHAGSRNVAVLNMTKEDLKLAEKERRDRGSYNIALADLWRYLYTHMKQGDEMVADRFSSEQIETLYRKIVDKEAK